MKNMQLCYGGESRCKGGRRGLAVWGWIAIPLWRSLSPLWPRRIKIQRFQRDEKGKIKASLLSVSKRKQESFCNAYKNALGADRADRVDRMVANLIEGQIYEFCDRLWMAAHMAGSWCLRLLEEVAMGEVVALRQVGDQWRECRYAPDNELFYGATVALDAAKLASVSLPDFDDDLFFALMEPLKWEWT